MSAMIDRIAAFLLLRDESVLPDEADDADRRGSAAAILELMREPTSSMKEATHLRDWEAAEIWEPMVDAALKDDR